HRQPLRWAGRRDARHRAYPGDEIADELATLLAGLVLARDECEGRHAAWVEAEVEGAEALDGSNEERRPGDEQHGECHLPGDKRAVDATRAASQSRFTALAVQTADRVETAAEHAPDGRHRDRGRDGEREEERRDKGHP